MTILWLFMDLSFLSSPMIKLAMSATDCPCSNFVMIGIFRSASCSIFCTMWELSTFYNRMPPYESDITLWRVSAKSSGLSPPSESSIELTPAYFFRSTWDFSSVELPIIEAMASILGLLTLWPLLEFCRSDCPILCTLSYFLEIALNFMPSSTRGAGVKIPLYFVAQSDEISPSAIYEPKMSAKSSMVV